jgi:hypothetical protein
MENALGIALSQPLYASRPGFFGGGSKLLTASWPSVLGMQAAFFAGQGMTGPTGILDSDDGFYDTFSYYPIRGAWSGLGRRWVTESLAVKRYPGCAYLDSGMDAMEEVLERIQRERSEPLDPGSIEAIHVQATVFTCEMERLAERYDQGSLHPVLLNFSLRYSLAWRLLMGGLRARDLTEDAVSRSEGELRSLAGKIHVEPGLDLNLELLRAQFRRAGLGSLLREMGLKGVLSVLRRAAGHYTLGDQLSLKRGGAARRGGSRISRESLVAWMQGAAALFASETDAKGRAFTMEELLPETFEFPFAARITVRLKDGSGFTGEQPVPAGAPGNDAVDLMEIALEKFGSEAEGILGVRNAAKAKRMLQEFPPDKRIRTLIPVLTVPASGQRSAKRKRKGPSSQKS